MHQMKRGLSPNITMSPLGKLRIHSLTNLPLMVFRKHKGGEIRTPAKFRTRISHVPRLQSGKNCFKVDFSIVDFRVTEVFRGRLLRFSGFLSSIPYEKCVSSSNNNLLTSI